MAVRGAETMFSAAMEFAPTVFSAAVECPPSECGRTAGGGATPPSGRDVVSMDTEWGFSHSFLGENPPLTSL